MHRDTPITRLSRAIIMLLMVTSLSACKIIIRAGDGGTINYSEGSCAAGQTCEIAVTDFLFSDTFTAVPDEGYSFTGWSQRDRGLCGGSTEPCALSTLELPRVPSVRALLDSDEEEFFLIAQFERNAQAADQPRAEAARFLSQATFGPTHAAVDALTASSQDAWLLAELEKTPTLHLDRVLAQFPPDGIFYDEDGQTLRELVGLPFDSFWRAAIEGDDQLRQRMAFALSQILVVSIDSNIDRAPQALAQYMDVLTLGAFGNYRDLLEDVTYSPAMAIYLTYLRNQKADSRTGRVPDENYAREILQLFTTGLVELQPNGKPVTDSQGNERELFDNEDITELAKVFTGLSFDGAEFNAPLQNLPLYAFHSPLVMFDAYHEPSAKQFLGGRIAAGTLGRDSIDQALDIIFANPNLGPFIGRQLIQRFVTSSPPRAYVRRVARAFDAGQYTLPQGEVVGSGRRGNLAAVIAAVLFDPVARDQAARAEPENGKLREPVLRFTHWARAFEINSADTRNERLLRNTGSPSLLGQQPYGAQSVFNFYRPGYLAVGKATGDAKLTAPELQITNASSIIGYPNFLTIYALGRASRYSRELPPAYQADYSRYTALVADSNALIDELDLILTHGTLTRETRKRILDVIDQLGSETPAQQVLVTQAAAIMIMTSPEYIVLR